MTNDDLIRRHAALLTLLARESDIVFLGTLQIKDLHDQCLLVSGGETGLRSHKALKEAADSPMRLAAAYPDADIVLLATNLSYSLAHAQPFMDGNKRTAVQALFQFMAVNGCEAKKVHADRDVLNLVHGVSSGPINEEAYYLSVLDCLSPHNDSEPTPPKP